MEQEKKRRCCWYWLSKAAEVDVKRIDQLLDIYEDIEAIYELPVEELVKSNVIDEKAAIPLQGEKSLEVLEQELDHLEQRKIYFVTREEEDYPRRLKEIFEAPYFLYYRGELPEDKPSIAIIGARDCSRLGSETAKAFAKELSDAGIQVISGLARGIDGFAHRGAIEGKTNTFGVIGSGVNRCYPKENYTLYEKMLLHGGILSEYPMDSNALPIHFPMRNRIIAGLSDGIFVVEARMKSGTLITVDRGLEQGKDIFAIPGSIETDLSAGCNRLIQNGAKLVINSFDIVAEYRNRYPHYFACDAGKRVSIREKKKETAKQLPQQERMIYQLLGEEPKHLEVIVYESKQPPAVVLELLFLLEMKQIIEQTSNHYYAIRM